MNRFTKSVVNFSILSITLFGQSVDSTYVDCPTAFMGFQYEYTGYRIGFFSPVYDVWVEYSAGPDWATVSVNPPTGDCEAVISISGTPGDYDSGLNQITVIKYVADPGSGNFEPDHVYLFEVDVLGQPSTDVFVSFNEISYSEMQFDLEIKSHTTVGGFDVEFTGVNILSCADSGCDGFTDIQFNQNPAGITWQATNDSFILPGSETVISVAFDQVLSDQLCFSAVSFTDEGGEGLETVSTGCIPMWDCSIPGDVNADGVLDVLDLVLIIYHPIYICGYNGSSAVHCSGDMNGDNAVDILDIVIIVGNILGM